LPWSVALCYKVAVTELERALADIAEVRERLAGVQRFRGYSAGAAILSGFFALAAGILQAILVPSVQTAAEGRVYFAIWFVCCAASMAVNYGAIAHWYLNDASARERWQTASVGFSILPALVVGAAIAFALLRLNAIALVPAVWYACYGVGLFASRTTIPRRVVPLAVAFIAAGIALLFTAPHIALAWWIMAAGFGGGQIAIGLAVAKDGR